MDKNEENILSGQIGDFGDSESVENEPQVNSLKGKKLQRVTNSRKFTDEDKEALNEMEEKIRSGRTLGKSQIGSVDIDSMNGISVMNNEIVNGWIPIDREDLGLRSLFYPEGWEFRIKPATVAAIKAWNQVDDTRKDVSYVLNNVFNEMLKTCFSISTPTGNLNWTHINSWDRFWFITRIREYTFSNRPYEFVEACDSCGEDIKFVLSSANLAFDYPDNDIIEKHYNITNRCWEIDPKEYDLRGPVIKFYVPTLGKDDAILQWAYAQVQSGKSIDETFTKFLPWMLSKYPKDAKMIDKLIKECYMVYKQWDIETFDFMDEILRNINITPEEKLVATCPHCGLEVRSAVQFQSGVKSLFTMESKHRKFGTK